MTNAALDLTDPGDQSNRETDAVSFFVTASGGESAAYEYSAMGLPSGVTIDTQTGQISGTLGAGSAGTYSVAVSATDGVSMVNRSFQWNVLALADAPYKVDLDVNGNKSLADAGDGAANYLPGYEGATAKVSTGNTFNTAKYVGQKMKLIVQGAGANSGITEVIFEITDVTSYAGYCGNATDAKITGAGKEQDFSFKELQDCVQFKVTPTTTEDQGGKMEQGFTWVDFWCKDYGGAAKVKVTLKKGDEVGATLTLGVPVDTENDKIAKKWIDQKTAEWEQQYKTKLDYVFSPKDDGEEKDPDGPGPLKDQKTLGDHITVRAEYRGFILDGGGFDGDGKNGFQGGHLRLSPARKEALVEVDRRKELESMTAATLRSALNGMARIWSQKDRGTGVYVYYILENDNLPEPDFSEKDLPGVAAQSLKEYLSKNRGVDKGSPVVNDAIKRYFTHFVVLSKLPRGGSYSKAMGTTIDETFVNAKADEMGVYLMTERLASGSSALDIPIDELGGVALAHELMHMVTQPKADGKTWDGNQHLVADPNGNELMAEGSKSRKGRQEATVVIGPLTQKEIDLANNPTLK